MRPAHIAAFHGEVPAPNRPSAPDTARRQRMIGLDLARLLALVGMVIVHARSDLVLLPLERLQPDSPSPQLPHDPAWAWWLQEVFTDRARPLFFTLAGVGVTLLLRSSHPKVLARRAVYIAALGIVLLLIGWSDLVLVFYGIWFLLGIALARARTSMVLAVGLGFALLPLLPPVADSAPDGTAFNISLILAETAYFCVGMALGRFKLSSPHLLRALLVSGGALCVMGFLGLAAMGRLGLDAERSAASEIVHMASTLGLVIAVIAAAVTIGEALPHSPIVKWLAVAGSVPLTMYVAHALLFTGLSQTWTTTLGPATLVAFTFLAAVVILAVIWVRPGRTGPLEALMRRVSRR